MGVPLLVALLGSAAAGPAIVTIVIDMVITTSLCVALSRLDGASEQGAAQATKNALLGMVKNPMPWSILLGTLFSAYQGQLPGPVDKTVALLADAASPVALFTIGAVLARSQKIAHHQQHGPLTWHDYVPVALIKLFLHPVLVLLVGLAAIGMGVPIDVFALKVMVLVAALPSASNVAMLSERFGADSGRIARIILVSTSAAFLTFSAAVALLQ
jgi:predicted permease